ncbi:MAG: BatD family protein, partial [Anaerolineales bacterium]|nr:BatD family protein [Anaerolineales bacterium]
MKLISSLGIAGILLAIVMIPGYAQIPGIITAEVDRNSISTDEAVLLTISIDASQGNPGPPTLPALEGFTVVSTSSGTQIMLVNGAMSVNATYEYWLRPVRAGTLVIEPVSVVLDGQLSQTQPISIQVTQGNGQPQALPAPNSPIMPAFPSLPGFPDIQSLFG